MITKRQTHIDLIEFMAIIMVITYHLGINNFNFIENPTILKYVNYLFRTILSTAVPLFFFANGYLLLNREFDLKKHVKKMLKLVFLSIIWGVIGLFLIMHIMNFPLTIDEFIENLINWKPLGWINHLWYIGALICIYVFLPLIKNAYDTNRKSFIYFLIICFIFTFINTFLCEVYTIYKNWRYHTNIIYVKNFFNSYNPFRERYGYTFVYFMLGGLIYNVEEKIRGIRPLERNIMAITNLYI